MASDTDLLLVYAGPHREDACAGVKRALAVPWLEVHAYAEEEYRRFGETNVSLGTLSPSSMTLG